MLVTFRTKASGNVTLFGDVAIQLLKMMGHSGTVPSAILARDIPAALASLRQALASAPAEAARPHDDDGEEPVGIRRRAYPLIELLTASAKAGADVMWEEGVPIP